MIKNTYDNVDKLSAADASTEMDTCTMENEKRRLVDSLEALRRDATKAPQAKEMSSKKINPAEKPHREEAFHILDEALRGQEELCMCVQALYEETNDIDIMQQNLRSADATCKMQEETIESFENKLLEAISENGQLYQQIDKAQFDLMTSKAVGASLARIRDNLRGRNEELRHLSETHRMALAAAEREILFLTAKFEEECLKNKS